MTGKNQNSPENSSFRTLKTLGFLLAALGILSGSPAVSGSPPAGKPSQAKNVPVTAIHKEKALFLELRGESNGTVRIYACEKSARLDMLDRHLQLIWKAPDWQTTLINSDLRRYWQGPPEQYRSNIGTTLAMFRPGDISALVTTVGKKKDYLGLACIEYKLESVQKNRKAPDLRTWERLVPVSGTILVLEKPHYPANVCRSMCQALSVVPAPGLPIAMDKITAGGKKKVELKILKYQETTVESSIFELPSGLKRVDKPEDATSSKEMNEGFSELLQ